MSERKAITPLTDEQRQFAEKHANLIWWFINEHRLGFNDPEKRNDWYCDLAETFLIAVQRYRPEMDICKLCARMYVAKTEMLPDFSESSNAF